MNVSVLKALFSDSEAYAIVEAPMRRLGGRSELSLAAAAAYSPDLN
jgi:hypothetical protein